MLLYLERQNFPSPEMVAILTAVLERRAIPSRRQLFTEEEIIRGLDKKKNVHYDVFDMRAHTFQEIWARINFQKCVGYTPSFGFESAGLKKEGEVNLLSHLINYEDSDETGLISLSDEALMEARSAAGKNSFVERYSSQIERIYTKLKEERKEFVIYRSYRKHPAPWDYIGFYSVGSFLDHR